MTNLMQEVNGFPDEQNLEGWRPRAEGKTADNCSGAALHHDIVCTLQAWSMVKNEGIMDFLREYLSCHRRSVFTLGSDATKN